jgi:ribosome small subunit-dependent GTPase A
MLDRYLVICEHSELPVVIVATKIDLVERSAAEAMFAPYARIGYPVVYTSIVTGEGIDELRSRLAGQISVVTGKSGVGKSSLLNAIQPGCNQPTRLRQDAQAPEITHPTSQQNNPVNIAAGQPGQHRSRTTQLLFK